MYGLVLSAVAAMLMKLVVDRFKHVKVKSLN